MEALNRFEVTGIVGKRTIADSRIRSRLWFSDKYQSDGLTHILGICYATPELVCARRRQKCVPRQMRDLAQNYLCDALAIIRYN